jgi:alginate O-acetyltransferase complex protein AlgI
MENFNWPIIARNIGEFWTRWHMTLAGWCQAYVYLPTIGWTRNPYLAVYATFLAMGLWHAGSMHFVCWGLYHATGVAVFQLWRRSQFRRRSKFLDRGLWRHAGVPVTFLFVAGSFAFTFTHGVGNWFDGFRILLRMAAVNVPTLG